MSEQPSDELREAVRARYPGPAGADDVASDAYWGWWVRWQQASAAERAEMESCL